MSNKNGVVYVSNNHSQRPLALQKAMQGDAAGTAKRNGFGLKGVL
jgi:hypothetical protein